MCEIVAYENSGGVAVYRVPFDVNKHTVGECKQFLIKELSINKRESGVYSLDSNGKTIVKIWFERR